MEIFKMKRSGFLVLIIVLIIGVWAQALSAAEVTLSWNPVDFAGCYSDLSQSGYKVYKSTDNGVTKTETGAVDTTRTQFSYTENVLGPVCFYATAYNQHGESAYSEPACVTIGAVPETPANGVTVTVTVVVTH
jgi:hypothetical protein